MSPADGDDDIGTGCGTVRDSGWCTDQRARRRATAQGAAAIARHAVRFVCQCRRTDDVHGDRGLAERQVLGGRPHTDRRTDFGKSPATAVVVRDHQPQQADGQDGAHCAGRHRKALADDEGRLAADPRRCSLFGRMTPCAFMCGERSVRIVRFFVPLSLHEEEIVARQRSRWRSGGAGAAAGPMKKALVHGYDQCRCVHRRP